MCLEIGLETRFGVVKGILQEWLEGYHQAGAGARDVNSLGACFLAE